MKANGHSIFAWYLFVLAPLVLTGCVEKVAILFANSTPASVAVEAVPRGKRMKLDSGERRLMPYGTVFEGVRLVREDGSTQTYKVRYPPDGHPLRQDALGTDKLYLLITEDGIVVTDQEFKPSPADGTSSIIEEVP